MSEHRMQMQGTDGLVEEPDSDQDLRWALEKFDGALGPDARPPADPEDEQDWSDWQDAWMTVRDRLLATRQERDVLEKAFTEACRVGFMEPEEMRESILNWAARKVEEES